MGTLRDLSNTCSFASASKWKYFPIFDNCILIHIIQCLAQILNCKDNAEWRWGGCILCKTIKFRDFRKLCAPWKSSKKGIIIQFPAHFRKEIEKRIPKKTVYEGGLLGPNCSTGLGQKQQRKIGANLIEYLGLSLGGDISN